MKTRFEFGDKVYAFFTNGDYTRRCFMDERAYMAIEAARAAGIQPCEPGSK